MTPKQLLVLMGLAGLIAALILTLTNGPVYGAVLAWFSLGIIIAPFIPASKKAPHHD